MGSFISSISRCFSSYFRRFTNSNVHVRLPDPDLEEGKPTGTIIGRTLGPIVKLKRRALLVGISYAHGPRDTWWELENPHKDVDMFRDLLVGTYGYSLEDITILKDGPNFPDDLQPTRDNLIRELRRLVAGAASGDKFTFFYSGHSDQQIALDDSEPEDGQDEGKLLSWLAYGIFFFTRSTCSDYYKRHSAHCGQRTPRYPREAPPGWHFSPGRVRYMSLRHHA
jgi:hypothetical protein